MCICIAVIHHLSTVSRRLAALKELTRIVRPGGRILISVWALEQNFEKKSRKNHNEGAKATRTSSKTTFTSNHVEKLDSDHVSSSCSTHLNIETTAFSGAAVSAMNNGVLCSKQEICSNVVDLSCQNNINSDTKLVSHANEGACTHNTSQDYRASSCKTGASNTPEILSAFSNTSSNEVSINEIQEHMGNSAAFKDKSVELKVNASRDVFEQQDLLIPWHYRGQRSCTSSRKKLTCPSDKHIVGQDEQELNFAADENKVPKVYQRFYHVFKENELENECRELDDISVARSYYDKGNWCVELEKLRHCSN